MSHLPWRIGAALVIVLLLLLVLGGGVAAAGALAPPLSDIEQLGKMLFFDEDLSLNGNQSCASCHAPEAGWTGPTSSVNAAGSVYEGSVPGAFGDRKPPSSAYGSFSPILHVDKTGTFIGGMFWDGRATGERLGSPLAEQAQGPFLNPMEQALPSAAEVVAIVAASGYAGLFEQVWGDIWEDTMAAYDAIGYSIAAYETSAESEAFTSKFDAWKAGTVSLTKQEAQGWAIFNGKGKCGKCHIARAVGGTPALFTDYTYDNLGIPKNPDNPATIAVPTWADPGLGGFLASRSDYLAFAADNLGKHKVPTLRNVDLRPHPTFVKAYGHNGYFKSLEEIVHFYNTRDVPGAGWMGALWPAPEVLDNVNSAELGDLGLTASQEADLVAFMKTLSDGYVPPGPGPLAAH